MAFKVKQSKKSKRLCICNVCGKKFYNSHPHSKYCGKECREISYFPMKKFRELPDWFQIKFIDKIGANINGTR